MTSTFNFLSLLCTKKDVHFDAMIRLLPYELEVMGSNSRESLSACGGKASWAALFFFNLQNWEELVIYFLHNSCNAYDLCYARRT